MPRPISLGAIQQQFAKLKSLGESQKSFLLWLKTQKKIENGFSASNLSLYLTGKRSSPMVLRKLMDYTNEYLVHIESKEHIKPSDTCENDRRGRGKVIKFIYENLTTDENKIQVLGIKNSDVKFFLESIIESRTPVRIHCEALFLSPNGNTAILRAKLEGIEESRFKSIVLQEEFLQWNKIEEKAHNTNISLDIRRYDILPSGKIVRINSSILYSPYLNCKGHFSPYVIYSEETDPIAFNTFISYYDFMYSNSS